MVVLGPAPPDLANGDAPNLTAGATSRKDDQASFIAHDLGNGQRLPLLYPGVPFATAPIVAFVPLGLDGFARLESIYRLLAALHGRAIPPDTRLTRQQRMRQRRMLQAIDGHRDGATQQEIAQVILRTPPLNRDDWQASSARHIVKSLLRDARLMIAGGYRKLLRHRRRS